MCAMTIIITHVRKFDTVIPAFLKRYSYIQSLQKEENFFQQFPGAAQDDTVRQSSDVIFTLRN